MPIPETDTFDKCIGTLTLQRPTTTDDYDCLEAVPSRMLSDHLGFRRSDPIWLWHRKSCPIGHGSLIQRLCKDLQHKGHLPSPEMARTVLGILCLTGHEGLSPVARLNNLLETICRADASHYLIGPFPTHPETTTFQLGRFSIGRLALDRLVYRCRKVKCDFFDRYPPRQFANRFAIEGSPVEVHLIDLPAVQAKFRIPFSDPWTLLADYYFDLLSQHQQESFRYELREAQQVFVAAGAPYIDLDSFQAWNGGSFVCIYESIGSRKAGYFCPLGMGIQVDFAQVDRRLPEKSEELKKEFSFERLGTSEIHQTLGTFCRFVMRAKTHEAAKRLDEAFLHYIIALDLLFGERDATTQTITKRTGIVVAKAVAKAILRSLSGSRACTINEAATSILASVFRTMILAA